MSLMIAIAAPARCTRLARRARRPSSVAVPGLCLLLAACGGRKEEPDIKLNPNARMRYEITVTLRDAPGPFDSIDGVVDYRVEDMSRVPEAPFSGAALYPTKQVSLNLERVAENVFQGEMYFDRLTDENYYGKGVCHWKVQGASIRLQGRPVKFIAAVDRHKILTTRTVRTYFARSFYTETQAMTDTGANSASDFKEPGQTFSVEVSSRGTTQ